MIEVEGTAVEVVSNLAGENKVCDGGRSRVIHHKPTEWSTKLETKWRDEKKKVEEEGEERRGKN